eukprot:scaffold34883_cov73-Skeletonema_marinoi.AAC.1
MEAFFMVEWSTRFHFEGRVYNRNCRNWYDVFVSFALKATPGKEEARDERSGTKKLHQACSRYSSVAQEHR